VRRVLTVDQRQVRTSFQLNAGLDALVCALGLDYRQRELGADHAQLAVSLFRLDGQFLNGHTLEIAVLAVETVRQVAHPSGFVLLRVDDERRWRGHRACVWGGVSFIQCKDG